MIWNEQNTLTNAENLIFYPPPGRGDILGLFYDNIVPLRPPSVAVVIVEEGYSRDA